MKHNKPIKSVRFAGSLLIVLAVVLFTSGCSEDTPTLSQEEVDSRVVSSTALPVSQGISTLSPKELDNVAPASPATSASLGTQTPLWEEVREAIENAEIKRLTRKGYLLRDISISTANWLRLDPLDANLRQSEAVWSYEYNSSLPTLNIFSSFSGGTAGPLTSSFDTSRYRDYSSDSYACADSSSRKFASDATIGECLVSLRDSALSESF